MTNNIDLIRRYLDVAVPGRLDVDRIGPFLAEDVVIDDPMMAMRGADDFIAALRQTPAAPDMSATVQDVVGEGDVVAARVLFEAEGTTVQFSQWFWVADDRITRIQVIYDTRPFLEAAAGS